MAIVLVEQYFEFAYALADTFYAMRRGAIETSGTKSELKKTEPLKAVNV